jgi:ATP-dependent Clp protease ATP-binding subunit ClpB
MTSNIASPTIQELSQRGVDDEVVRLQVLEELRAEFRPEFLNRIDDIIFFLPLSREQIGAIVEIQLSRLRNMLADRHLKLELTPAARSRLADEGFDPIYGARPLKRAIQQRLQNALALSLLQGEFSDGDTILVDVDAGNNFTFTKALAANAVVS